jgi:DNA-binding GntR family transcriptional regulator
MSETPRAEVSPQDIVSSAAVAEYLKQRIRSGHLVAGQRLVEADIMRETGASRGRVREALQRLVVEDIVVGQDFRGASVKRMSRAEIDQNYRAREVLESLCARLVAERGTPEARDAIQALQAEMNHYEEEGDPENYSLTNARWHEAISAASGNAYAQSFLERLRIPIISAQFRRNFSRKKLVISNANHRLITAAMVNGDADAAERLMREHIREALLDFQRNSDDAFGP